MTLTPLGRALVAVAVCLVALITVGGLLWSVVAVSLEHPSLQGVAVVLSILALTAVAPSAAICYRPKAQAGNRSAHNEQAAAAGKRRL